MLTIIVARARNGVIGAGNSLPWRLPEDLRHFREMTTGHPVIMGRVTFESIGRPLPGRRNIVVTRDRQWRRAGCESAASLAEAIDLARRPGVATHDGEPCDPGEIFIAGGATLYREAIGLVDRLVVTEVDLEPDGDAHFDAPDPAVWRESSHQSLTSRTGVAMRIVDYRRMA